MRPFDAALLIGADAQHLPQAPAEFLFMSNAVRAELSLPTAESAQRAQAAQLASLLATVPRVIATWRRRHGDEANSLSSLLERLQFVAVQAAGDDLLRRPQRAEFEVAVAPTQRPAPQAPQLLPARLSVSHCQSLVDCAYQFYARCLLQLRDLEDVIEVPDKRGFGRTLHQVLLHFHLEWQHRELHLVAANDLAASLQAHARAEFDPQIERTPAMLSFHRRFEGLIAGYIAWLQARSRAGWHWRAGEESIVAELRAPGGRTGGRTEGRTGGRAGERGAGRVTELRGRIDRIDRRSDGATQVLDYKARTAADLSSGLIAAGEDVQLPLYGLLAHAATSAAYLSFDRARDGEPGVKLLAPKQPFAPLVAGVSQRLRLDLQRIAEGVPLPAIGAATVCEKCEMRGLCRRDFWELAAAEQQFPQSVPSP